ncbi:MAG: hypothetical protein A2498_04055 [Lentisphaerae bacterium RIFOXYC12_FULL_60_16]|nr:MAG: hypothetical protein A2498_04055 [Lentisphaerae bacterium RIFOXYC12_FULL_60_16]OGV79561.1 MAG: hypothetical protein A2340_11245 [Lentisphaerae bacterium RIFOXYB12_FULL_60_10]
MDTSLDLWLLFVRPLNRLSIEYMVTGSAASMAYGEPRLTLDVDIVLELSKDGAKKLVQAFPEPDFYCPPLEVIRVESDRVSRGHLNIIHISSGFKADLYPIGRDALHTWGMARRKHMEFSGETVLLAPPEYVIIRKLEYFREGGSEKHLQDIAGILRISANLVDHKIVKEWCQRLGVSGEWKQALKQAGLE